MKTIKKLIGKDQKYIIAIDRKNRLGQNFQSNTRGVSWSLGCVALNNLIFHFVFAFPS